jgi:hypothetical protein
LLGILPTKSKVSAGSLWRSLLIGLRASGGSLAATQPSQALIAQGATGRRTPDNRNGLPFLSTPARRRFPAQTAVLFAGAMAGGLPRLYKGKMRIVAALSFALLALGAAAAAERMRFWNTTSSTVTELYLAPTGTTEWGPNLCKNDPDGAVDADERLTLKNVVPGHYDVKLVDKQGRSCVVRNVEVQAGKPYAFSLSEKDLTDCSQ